MDGAVEAVETTGWFLALALTHAPMMVFTLYASLTIVERALGSKRGKVKEKPPAREAPPYVCVQLPMYNEPACAKRAIDAACLLHWPQDLIEIQVLDDSSDGTEDVVDDACAEWRERGVVCNALRASAVLRGKSRQTKAAALEYGRARTSADLIVVLDADAVVEEDYLAKIVPYFYDERGERRSEVAVVQPDVTFKNSSQNFLTMHQAFKMEADAIVGNRAYIRAFGCALRPGSGAIWSAAALRAVGGWDVNMLALEGTDMSMRTRMAGYSGKAAANVIIETELPSTLSAYKSQQLRWMWAWAYLAKRHLASVLFNSFNGVTSDIGIGVLNGNVARLWFALTIVRPAQWLLLAVWLLLLPELIFDGMWLGNAQHVIHGAVWLYFLPLLLILKADTFAMSDVEGKVRSPPKSTGEAMSTMRTTLRKLSWIGPHACVSLGMIAVYCTGYVRGIFGSTYPSFDAPVSQLRTPKLGNGDVELSEADRGADETSCSKSEIWQIVFEMAFVVATIRASIELMKWAPTGGSGAGTISLVSVIGFGIAACCVYVAAGSWDDKCGPRSSERYRRAKTSSVEERAGLLSSTTAAATLAPPRRINMSLSSKSRRTKASDMYGTSSVPAFDVESGKRTPEAFSVGDEDDVQPVSLDVPALTNAKEMQKAIKKYKNMRDHNFDLENFSEYAQSDATSVMSENHAPSHVNFGSHAPSHEDFGSEIGSAFGDGDDDERSVEMDGKDRAALAHAMQAQHDSQQRAKSLRMANLRVNTAPAPNPKRSRPPRSPRSSNATSADNSPRAPLSPPTAEPPTPISASDWVDSPIVVDASSTPR